MLEIRINDEYFEFDDGDVVSIGRADSCSVAIDDHRVSRRHLELSCDNGYWRVLDLGSANGTFAAGRRVQEIALRSTLDVSLADPDSGVVVRLSPQGATATINVTPPEGSAYALRIGRARDNDIALDDTKASRYHAELIPRGATAEIRDCGSANGTRVNGEPVDRHEVRVGDLVEIGDTTMRVVQASNRLILEVVAHGATIHPDSGSRQSTPVSTVIAESPTVTKRERDLLALVAGGASDKAIAEDLFISVATVRSHLDRIQVKTGRRKRADLTRLAYELGIEPRSIVAT